MSTMSASRAPSKTGVATGTPLPRILGQFNKLTVIESVDGLVLAVSLGHGFTQVVGAFLLPVSIERPLNHPAKSA